MTFTSDLDLYTWMRKNIKYRHYNHKSGLMSPKAVETLKTGSCHDQVLFELNKLQTIPDIQGLRGWFIIESNEMGQGGMTHSVVTYTKDHSLYYFEHSWCGRQGITKIKDIEEVYQNLHKQGIYGNIDQYPNLEIFPFVGTPGMSLHELVQACVNADKT